MKLIYILLAGLVLFPPAELVAQASISEKQDCHQLLNTSIKPIYTSDDPKAIDSGITYLKRVISCAERLGDDSVLAYALLDLGKTEVVTQTGNRETVISYFLKSVDLFEELGDSLKKGEANLGLGILYYELNDVKSYQKALQYFKRIIHIETLKARGYYLMAICYSELNDFDKAKYYFSLTKQFIDSSHSERLIEIDAFLGKMYANMGDTDTAIAILESSFSKYPAFTDSSVFLLVYTHLAEAYYEAGHPVKALKNARKAYRLTLRSSSSPSFILNAVNALHRSFSLANQSDSAYYYSQKSDSLSEYITNPGIYLVQEKYYNDQKEIKAREERKKYESRLYLAIIGLALAGVVAYIFYAQSKKIATEKDRSESLLLNILPAEIAEELKKYGRAKARNFADVSILFTDFKEFTKISEKLSPAALVEEINACYQVFDEICESCQIEKIKTIGDSYMAAGGLPTSSPQATKNTVVAALKMSAFIQKRKQEREKLGLPAFQMRLGIHTGQVVAGIVGKKKIQYDVWGDTVNTASRMESAGAVDKVNISQTTYGILKDDPDFIFEHRGKIEAKGKGKVDMYFVRPA